MGYSEGLSRPDARGRLVTEVESFLRRLPGDEIGSSHRLVASLVAHGFVKTIITTNYDTLIEDACARMGAHLHVVAHESQLHGAAGDAPVLYKIHFVVVSGSAGALRRHRDVHRLPEDARAECEHTTTCPVRRSIC